MLRRFLILLTGVFCAATSVIMTKASQLSPELLSSGRLLVATLVLSPLFMRDKKRFPVYSLRRSFQVALLPAILLALHFITWTIGARLTASANSTLIVNLIPVAMPLFGYWVLKEKLSHREWMGTAMALLGVVVLAYTDFKLNFHLLKGDAVCLLSMLLMAWYLILARKNKEVPSLWLYLVPLYAIAGLLCLVFGIVRNGIPSVPLPIEWIWILLLGFIPTVLGHSLLNLSMQWFRSQVVALVNQLQFVFAGFLGFFIFSEIPQPSFFLASACMLAGVVWIVVAKRKQHSRPA